MIQVLFTLISVLLAFTVGTVFTYLFVKLYLKINSKKLKEEFSWFGGKQHRKIMKKYGLEA